LAGTSGKISRFHRDGVRGYGLKQRRTPIDLVLEHGGAPDAVIAALWLCGVLGVEPAILGAALS
jgi:hypothetical protein